jgi:hypothetical protein
VNDKVSDPEVREALPLHKEVAWCQPEIRSLLEESGVQIIPSGFNLTIPTIMEIEDSSQFKSSDAPFSNPAMFSVVGMYEVS